MMQVPEISERRLSLAGLERTQRHTNNTLICPLCGGSVTQEKWSLHPRLVYTTSTFQLAGQMHTSAHKHALLH